MTTNENAVTTSPAIHTMNTKRIGAKMRAAVDYVRRHPGCAKLPIAEHVGPYGSRQYGYSTVDRAIAAGLIRAVPQKGGRFACFATEAEAEAEAKA